MTLTAPSSAVADPLSSESCRAIVFAIAGHFLALPLTAVVKVISASNAAHLPTPETALIYLDGQPITYLNLHSCLSAVAPEGKAQRSQLSGQFLLIATDQDQQFAILVNEAPTLLDLPFSTIRPLPATYCHSIQHIASHVAVVPNPDSTQMILLLQLQSLTQAK
jgi:chemotaxis signal transduction protein